MLRFSSANPVYQLSKLEAIKHRQASAEMTFSESVLEIFGLQSGEKPCYPIWEQLVREVVHHMHQPDFREEFYPLIKNEEVNLRLLTMHLWLLSDRLKHSKQGFLPPQDWWRHRSTLFIFRTRSFPQRFYRNQYKNFQNYQVLPEHLFLEDFTSSAVKTTQQTFRSLDKAFKVELEGEQQQAALQEAVLSSILGEGFSAENPMNLKLSLYILAHRNYLGSLSWADVRDYRINWGLKEQKRLEE